MTREDLINLGFEGKGHLLLKLATYDLGRNRFISSSDIGTPNEFVYLIEVDEEYPEEITDLICIHNFDYDGYITEKKIKMLMSLKSIK